MNDTKKSILNSEFEFHLSKNNILYNTTFLSFFIPFFIGIVMFFPFCVWTKGIFVYFGDFNSQQVPFYVMCHDAVRNGEIGWNWITDLGSNFIGSYSFYLLGSPFFWLTIPFPSECIPYLMAPLIILKLSFMSLAAFLFLSKFVNKKLSLIGAILYAFSGYTMFNLVYNHFLEAMIYLPLMLYALECRMEGKKKGLFVFFVFLSAINNYYFFIGQAIFLIIYWSLRLTSASSWDKSFKTIFFLYFEAFIGTAMAGILLLPSYLMVIQNYRANVKLSGWDLLLYVNPKRYLNILHSFFFPQDNPVFANFFPETGDDWLSISAWIPMFGCTGALAFLKSKGKENWLKRMIILLFIFSMIPFLNASFQLFSSQYYARWFYMFSLMLILATLIYLNESIKSCNTKDWKKAFLWSFGFIGIFSIIGITPTSWNFDTTNDDFFMYSNDSWGFNNEKIKLGLEPYPAKFWICVGIAIAGLVLSALMVSILIKRKKNCFRILLSTVCVYTLIVSGYTISIGKEKDAVFFPEEFYTEIAIAGKNEVNLPTDLNKEWYRTDFYDGKNLCFLGMAWQTPSIQAFHSIVPGSTFDFYNAIGVARNVRSTPDVSHYSLRSLLSVKYLLDYTNTGNILYRKSVDPNYFLDSGKTVLDDYELVGETNGFNIYENNNYIPMGFTYDYYVLEDEVVELEESERELMLLKALEIKDKDYETVKKVLKKISVSKCDFSKDSYKQDCKNRKNNVAKDFTITKEGFDASISLDKDNYVFFSVPYEKGWKAEVNGKNAPIIESNFGFMSVLCKKGESQIKFSYNTPGLKAGEVITLCSFLSFLIYLVLANKNELFKTHKK